MPAQGGIDRSDALKGISAIFAGVLIFTTVDATAKWLSGAGFHPTQIVLMRYVFGLLPVLVAILASRGAGLWTQKPGLHLTRGLLMCTALLQFFWGLKYVPLAEALAVAFTAPLFITALSVPILGEEVGRHRWAAVAAGFAGMLIILRPGMSAFQPQSMLIVSSAVTYALGVVMTRQLAATETNTAIFSYTTVFAIAVMAPFGITLWQPPEALHLALFVMVGLLGGAAHYLIIIAYRHVPVSVNSPFEYTGLVWGSLFGWLIWRETPDLWVLSGAAIIVASGLYITYRETQARPVDA